MIIRKRKIQLYKMLGYVDKISSNEMKDKNGRLIKTGTNTQFYLYAVCDITSKLRKIAEDFDFIETPDKRGMYKYHDKSEHTLKSCRLTKLLMMQEKGIEYYLKNLVFNTKVRYDVHKQLRQTEDVSED